MVCTVIFRYIFFAFLIQLSMPCALFSMEFELFSISYGDEVKINILEIPVHDPEMEKKKAEDTENCNTETQVTDQEIHKTNQENNLLEQQVTQIIQKTKIIEQQTNKTKQQKRLVNNRSNVRNAKLKKALEEL